MNTQSTLFTSQPKPQPARPKEDRKGKRKNEEENGVPEELLAALNFAALEGSIPPWAAGGKNWDPENGGLTEHHIQVRPPPHGPTSSTQGHGQFFVIHSVNYEFEHRK